MPKDEPDHTRTARLAIRRSLESAGDPPRDARPPEGAALRGTILDSVLASEAPALLIAGNRRGSPCRAGYEPWKAPLRRLGLYAGSVSLVVHIPDELARRPAEVAEARHQAPEQVALEAIETQLPPRRSVSFSAIGASGTPDGDMASVIGRSWPSRSGPPRLVRSEPGLDPCWSWTPA